MSVNYLEQINGFQRWKEVNPLPASAIALWYELLATCNKAGWPEEFTVRNAVIQASAGLSRKQFDSARQMLIDMGLIRYKKSQRVNSAGKYSMNYFPIVQNGQQKGQQEGQQEGQQTEHRWGNKRDIYINKTKLNQTNNTPTTTNAREETDERAAEVFSTFEREGFGTLSSFLVDELNDMVETYSAEWVIRAMHEAVRSGKRNLKYVSAILRRWKSDGPDDTPPWGGGPNAKHGRSAPRGMGEYDYLSL